MQVDQAANCDRRAGVPRARLHRSATGL